MEELYDIKADPYCLTNLSQLDAFDGIRADLWRELEQLLNETGDPRIFGNGDVFESYEYVSEAPHSWAHYVKGDWKPQPY